MTDRIEQARQHLLAVFTHLSKRGVTPFKIDDGGEEDEHIEAVGMPLHEAVEHCMAVEWVKVMFTGTARGAAIFMPYEGVEDILSDCTEGHFGDLLDEAMAAAYEEAGHVLDD